MENLKAEYQFDAINKSQLVEPRGCNTITFRNIGDDPVLINGIIPLQTDDEFTLDNHYRIQISSNTDIKFAGSGTNPNLAVIRKYIKK